MIFCLPVFCPRLRLVSRSDLSAKDARTARKTSKGPDKARVSFETGDYSNKISGKANEHRVRRLPGAVPSRRAFLAVLAVVSSGM
jgi:hypothetical protein